MFNYKWNLSDYPKKNGLKVFSTFACGGGSTMGYKLAGFEVIGVNDIDPQMARVYKTNHNPKHYYLESITDFNKRIDLPNELYSLDILDGSPPCSTFSMAGSREKAWGKDKKFREGQATQVLDDLFFSYIETIQKLRPKVFIAENVKGMLAGNAKGYLVEIMKQVKKLGYEAQIFLLNGASMGLPQKRERVFIIGNRMNYSKLKLKFNEKPITFREATKDIKITIKRKLTGKYIEYWKNASPGESVGKFMTKRKIVGSQVLGTIDANQDGQFHDKQPRHLTNEEYMVCGSFPLDYNFLDVKPKYLIGMSVPPVMMAQVSSQVYNQWFKYSNNNK